MTNFDRWQFYMKDAQAPQAFIDMGFYWMISAALQRRVWLQDYERALFPNLYVILVGEAGTGKGVVIKPIYNLLTSLLDAKRLTNPVVIEQIAKAAKKHSDDSEGISTKDVANDYKRHQELALFPCAPDTVTFQALTKEVGESIRWLSVPKSPLFPRGRYMHTSVMCLLEELGTMFRKNETDLINFLLKAYDAGDFRYRTKNQGEDIIKNVCLSLLGGTTPNFMVDSFSDKILSEGFSSRTIFVYGGKPRFYNANYGALSDEQKATGKVISEHLEALSKLFGEVKYTDEAMALRKYLLEELFPTSRINKDPTLDTYYSRKNIHVQKLALAVHFSESLDMVITKDDLENALRILNSVEEHMHKALVAKKRNPLRDIAVRMVSYISDKGAPVPASELFMKFYEEVTLQEYEECLKYLTRTKQIATSGTSYVILK